ncbi:MAG: dTDP-4-amino-4,6-dideoxygalactose transaminase [Parvicella sp.]|jgi:dTDP-4-amino-4,6-dideoxygalactose transaminase
MNIPFSLPLIDDDVVSEVNDALLNTGWLTSGPKVVELEKEFNKLTGCQFTVCVNSWSSGAMLMLKWFGIGPGDEVIIPSYTYSATALVVMNIGATPVMVDVNDDFNINVENIRKAITKRTKAIIPVDIGGLPCDYDAIRRVVNDPEIISIFQPESDNQRKLGRLFILSDAAHSIGATYKGFKIGTVADATVFSLHSVKNITTGEGGAICFNIPEIFETETTYKFLKAFLLNGQTKSAFEKNQPGAWRYDIIAQGLKVNLPDICAAIGLAQIRKYEIELLPERNKICDYYDKVLAEYNWAILPIFNDQDRVSSRHLYLLRIAGISELERDQMIHYISYKGVGVNVHYIPMPMFTLFKSKGYNIEHYPNTLKLYASEITLPVYNGLSEKSLQFIIDTLVEAYQSIKK